MPALSSIFNEPMECINPQAWIHIDVKGEDSTVTNWMIEAAAPNSLLRRGFQLERNLQRVKIFGVWQIRTREQAGCSCQQKSHLELGRECIGSPAWIRTTIHGSLNSLTRSLSHVEAAG